MVANDTNSQTSSKRKRRRRSRPEREYIGDPESGLQLDFFDNDTTAALGTNTFFERLTAPPEPAPSRKPPRFNEPTFLKELFAPPKVEDSDIVSSRLDTAFWAVLAMHIVALFGVVHFARMMDDREKRGSTDWKDIVDCIEHDVKEVREHNNPATYISSGKSLLDGTCRTCEAFLNSDGTVELTLYETNPPH